MSTPETPLWTCPRCGHQFVSRNIWHSCGHYDLDSHFLGKDPILRETFDRLVEITNSCGPVTVYAQKTRIVFMARVRFGGVMVKKHTLDWALWLTRRVDHPLLHRIEVFGVQSYGLHFRLTAPGDIDQQLVALTCEAYKTGLQEHLQVRNRKP
jgi:hypothetical protein